ncbi:MAG: hypothetical protein KDD67_06885 [Ignavibacteriae bacterium]|nr:hypothetical protein [Ignavibacteriota bacterium]MCB9215202.1 hypothetical protein [Ignavibacteria bacterium]
MNANIPVDRNFFSSPLCLVFVLLFTLLGMVLALPAQSQNRDFNAERLVIDDNGDDGTRNTMTIQAPNPLTQNVILTIPDLGSDSAQFLLVPAGTTGAWLLNGNTGTTPGTDFLGTSDAQALHLYVNGGSSNSLILNTNGSIQRDAGGNGRGGEAVDLQISRNGATQVASGQYSTIGGGRRNTAINIAATVAGGDQNVAEGRYTTVGGGTGNIARSSDGFVTAAITVGGGHQNQATGVTSTIAGGAHNTASGSDAVIGGGAYNSISGQTNTIGGGVYNSVTGYRSAIGGGDRNSIESRWSVVPGGRGLTLGGESSFGFLGGNRGGTVVSRGNNRMTVSEDDIALFGNVDLLLANNDGAASRLRFYEANSAVDSLPTATTFYTSFEAGDQSEDINYILPPSIDSVGGILDITGVAGSQVQLGWTTSPNLSGLRLNSTTPLPINSRLVLNEGHLTSTGTSPSAVGDGTNLALAVTVDGSATDVAGIVTATDGGSVGTGVITITFNAAYAGTPVVMIVPANVTAATASSFVSNVSTTSFDLNISTTSGNGTDTYVFNYLIVETD